MPLAIISIIRSLILTIVQLGIWTGLTTYGLPLFNRLIQELIEIFGFTKDEAKDMAANETLYMFESVGIFAATLRTKLPIKIADMLGFTAKGFSERALTAGTINKIKTWLGAGKVSPILLSLKSIDKVKTGMSLTTKILGLAIAWNLLTDWVWIGNSLNLLPADAQNDIQKRALAILGLINAAKGITITASTQKRQVSQQERDIIKRSADEAEKQIKELRIIYENKFIAFGRADVATQLKNSTLALELELEALRQVAGLIPRKPVVAVKINAVVSAVFDGDTVLLDNGETVRLLGIDAPESTTPGGEVSKKYLKERLVGKSVRVESDPNAMIDMYGRRLGVIYLNDVNINIEMLQKDKASFYEFEPNALVFKKQWKAAEGAYVGLGEIAPTVKIFTGVLSQGKLGAAEPFITRKSDLIDSMQELQQAAGNNLTSFILALPGRIIYEIKIVSSVTTKDGFTQRGAARQITTGYTKAGKPKIKTVINKFAIIDVFVFTERNVKTRIQKIVLGPVDSVAFQPKGADLQIAEQSIKANLITSSVEEIKTIVTDSPPPIVETIIPTEITKVAAEIKTAQTTISEEQKQAEPAEWRARQMFATLATTKVTEATAAIETAQRAANVLTSAQQLATVAQQALTVSRTPITQAAVIATQAMVTQAQAIAAAAVAQAKLATLTAQQTVAKILPTTAPVMITPPAMITPTMPAIPYSNNPNRMNAQSIAEFFDINKQTYPSIPARSKFYEAYGLGPATWYTGTGEQNIKLLAEFKKRYGK